MSNLIKEDKIQGEAIFKDLGYLITDFRNRKNITQKELAKKCEISSSYLSQIEKGHKVPSYSLIKKICENLNISQNDLMRLLFINSFIETNSESKQEIIAILRNLLDKLLVDNVLYNNNKFLDKNTLLDKQTMCN